MTRLDRPELLQTREKTHGSFSKNAEISQALKSILHAEMAHEQNVVFRESIDMICLKLSRIASGQASVKDHWDDISGYALLASEVCP